ncbi:MAG TPA: imidazole glycerol phosphate synthase subunit HisF [Methanothrix sp.]|nr:imidazole glycerol phosphate synthase subunit HisF [Methanothrix sp.]HPT37326.1 imidazole glycerol phosphate synthase subunit HisF [Methanothrix sp.]
MLARRIIPCLDCDLGVPGGRVVKGIEFKQIRYAGIPWELAAKYYQDGADEIVFLDITASSDRRETMTEVIKKTSRSVFVPLAIGGGIKSVEQAREVFNAGADKISVNTSALKRPELISEIAERYGNQAVVLAIDAKRRYNIEEGREIVQTAEGPCWFECSFYGGREFTGIDAIAWAKKAVSLGAGEILLTSMDRDGTYDGFDIPLTDAVAKRVRVPVIASGGCASPEHMYEVFSKTDASAALAASIFHFGEWTVGNVKAYLKERGINVRV